jgi:hypothetical protein
VAIIGDITRVVPSINQYLKTQVDVIRSGGSELHVRIALINTSLLGSCLIYFNSLVTTLNFGFLGRTITALVSKGDFE